METSNYLGGMEYPGLVVVEDNVYVSGTRLQWLTAHEVAHQWWFGVVGNNPINEPWLDEALTHYQRHRYQIATPESFLATLEDVTVS